MVTGNKFLTKTKKQCHLSSFIIRMRVMGHATNGPREESTTLSHDTNLHHSVSLNYIVFM